MQSAHVYSALRAREETLTEFQVLLDRSKSRRTNSRYCRSQDRKTSRPPRDAALPQSIKFDFWCTLGVIRARSVAARQNRVHTVTESANRSWPRSEGEIDVIESAGFRYETGLPHAGALRCFAPVPPSLNDLAMLPDSRRPSMGLADVPVSVGLIAGAFIIRRVSVLASEGSTQHSGWVE